MRRNLAICLLTFIALVGCTEEELIYDRDLQLQLEKEAIEKYLEDNGIQASLFDDKYHYVINEPGTGERPETDDQLTLDVTVFGLDGTFYHSTDARVEVANGIRIAPGAFDYRFRLGNAFISHEIRAIPELIRLVREGGSIEFFTPSQYAYGIQGYSNTIGSPSGVRRVIVPPNTTLHVSMKLINITQ